jgi:signal-transduction protein with cAMP-binding, CBS, and nucleotidyltransferase domain
MKKKINQLNESELTLLKSKHEVLSFSSDFDLVYEKQIPNTGVAVVDGEVQLTRKSRVLETVGNGAIIGVQQLMRQEPVKLGAKVTKNSKIILLGRSDIEDALNDKASGLSPLMTKIIEGDEKI